MSLDQRKAAIIGRIWQSIAQSGVNVSALPQDQLETMVNAIADGMLLAMDDMLAEIGAAQGIPPAPDTPTATTDEEQVLWSGRPFLSLGEYYEVTNERIRIVRGLFGRAFEDIDLIRVQDVDYSQRMTERMVNIGDITIRSADPSHPEITLRNVSSPAEVHETIRKAVQNARERHRVGFREEI